jgi:two-component system NtrC family sensor kinase
MTTENWIALFFILLVPVIALLLTLRHRHQEEQKRYATLEQAYRSLDREISQRTQNLRGLNNSLQGEIQKLEKTEAKLHQSENYLHSIIDSMPSILISVTGEGVVTHWNSSAKQHTGKTEAAVLGSLLWEAYPELPVEISMIQAAITEKLPKARQNFKQVTDGITRYYEINIYPLLSSASADSIREAIIQVDDVSLQIKVENAMVQNEKMLSLGQMAAGMAHEINNPLGAILQHLQNIERRLSPSLKQNQMAAEKSGTSMEAIGHYVEDRQIGKMLSSIRDAGERSARIVSNMLGFSHMNVQHRPVDIHELIDHCLELAQHRFILQQGELKIPISLQKDYSSSMPLIYCSSTEIQQVILNLLRNATQCFIDESGKICTDPTVTIGTYLKDSALEINVSDNGIGMSEIIRRQVFEPFFTTKEVGSGTGLGLSVSYFIISKHHGGNIEVDSTPGAGTTFTVTLPLSPAPT